MDTTGVDGERVLRTFLDLVAVDSPTGHEGEIGNVAVPGCLPRPR